MRSAVRKPEAADVCLVGAGATGGTVAKVLTEAGLSVVAIECGPWMRPDQFSADELKYQNRGYLTPDPFVKPRTMRPDENSVAEPFPFSPLPQMVGGGTVHWNAWVPRPMPSDFIQRSLHGDIPGATLADWPITYDELEPYLTKVEWAFGTSGLAGANRYEPPRSAPYPCPPPPLTNFGRKFYEGCAKLGVNGFPVPQGMVTTAHNHRRPASCTGFWNLYGDPTSGKSSTLTTFIPQALSTGRFELRPDCYVREVTLHPDGSARGVIYIDQAGNEIEQEAKLVILCAAAVESARLLLLSRSSQFPDGLANSSGLVGRNATFHEYCLAAGLFDKEVDDPLYGWTGYYLNGGSFEFYETDESRGHICGSFITASGTLQPVNWVLPDRPIWGTAMKDADRDYFNYAMKIGMIVHDLPRETNRVDLDPNVVDAWGLPAARITHTSHPNDVALAKWQVAKNAEILEAAGAKHIVKIELQQPIPGTTTHQHGTARMGNDPAKSVLNKWCRAHDVPNLYVLDGSSFPTALGVNPTLTMMANAWRCADYIASVHAKGSPDDAVRSVFVQQRAPYASKSDWPVADRKVERGTRKFFDEHQWQTIEAACARVIPTDRDPGAREAGVIVFIDHYLSGVEYVYAAADGQGFLDIGGHHRDAWAKRIARLQELYRTGVVELDRLARDSFQADFKDLLTSQQDDVLERLSGEARPEPLRPTLGDLAACVRFPIVSDDTLSFFEALVLHTRQGFYGDPAYGGNVGRVGWRTIGFDGPESLADSQTGRYSVEKYMQLDAEWPYVEVAELERAK
jgi:choline dehydrogenase-like flavoprotein